MPHTPPDAEVLIATGCAHCPAVLQALSDLVKEGLIRQLRVSNIVADAARAQELGVRTTPWTRIGPFTLAGNYSPAELRHWAEQAGSDEGIADYIRTHLKDGELKQIETFLSGETFQPNLDAVRIDINVRCNEQLQFPCERQFCLPHRWQINRLIIICRLVFKYSTGQ